MVMMCSLITGGSTTELSATDAWHGAVVGDVKGSHIPELASVRSPTDAANLTEAVVLFFVSGHVPPLLRNVEDLFLDKGIARLFGEFFALSCLGAVLVCLGCHDRRPRQYATWQT